MLAQRASPSSFSFTQPFRCTGGTPEPGRREGLILTGDQRINILSEYPQHISREISLLGQTRGRMVTALRKERGVTPVRAHWTTPAPPATALRAHRRQPARLPHTGLRSEGRGGGEQPLTSYQLRHLPDAARDLCREHGEVLLVALEVGGHHGDGGAGGAAPHRFRVLPHQNASPTPPPVSLPHVPAKLRDLTGTAQPLSALPTTSERSWYAGSRHTAGTEERRQRRVTPAPQPLMPRLVTIRGRNAVAALPEGRCFPGGRIRNGPRAGGGGRASPAPAPLRPFPARPFPLPSLPSSSHSLPSSLPALSLGGRREPCTAAAGRRRPGGGSGHGGAGRAAAGAPPVPLGPGGGAGRGGRVLRHRHGRRRALVLAPGHGRGKRQLRDAAQLDRHDPLQLLQRHVRGPRVRPAGVDAGKRCLATASSRGLAGPGGQPWGRAGPPAVRTVQIACPSMPLLLLCPPRTLHALRPLLPPSLVPKSFLCLSPVCSCRFQSFQHNPVCSWYRNRTDRNFLPQFCY